jgi:hypothetical protein
MIGSASTPIACHASAIRWNEPKCNRKMRPSMPIQPCSMGLENRCARPHRSATPRTVFAKAASHWVGVGLGGTRSGSRKAEASMPGQRIRYAIDLHVDALDLVAVTQVSHLHPVNRANDINHMKAQAGSRFRVMAAASGSTPSGSQATTAFEGVAVRSALMVEFTLYRKERSNLHCLSHAAERHLASYKG